VTIAFLALLLGRTVALPNAGAPVIRAVGIGHGITLHYVEAGKGTPVIFVHGLLSDEAIGLTSSAHLLSIIGRSRIADGTNYPNINPARPGYSAVVDAEDLASLYAASFSQGRSRCRDRDIYRLRLQ
jgi:hypothetical protein